MKDFNYCIVVPVYETKENFEKFVKLAEDLLTNQNEIEIIFVDDGNDYDLDNVINKNLKRNIDPQKTSAEKLNGRFALVGVILLAAELIQRNGAICYPAVKTFSAISIHASTIARTSSN